MMRPLEIMLLAMGFSILGCSLAGRPVVTLVRVLSAVILLLLTLHVVIEGVRWQMVPCYIVTCCLLLAFFWPQVTPRRWVALSGMGLLAAAVAAGSLVPVFDLPKPTGAYPPGTVTLHLVDCSREETASPRLSEHRELMIQIWYPAARTGPREAYRTRAETSVLKGHLALVRTHAAAGVPVAAVPGRYPVVIFSPSWRGQRHQNIVQAEELASHGFLVVGIDHPYATDATVFPDGRIARTTLGEAPDFSSDPGLDAFLRTAGSQLQIRTLDVRFVLDELEKLDRSDATGLLTGRIDTSRMGIFGHSFGGAVAAEVCRTDTRMKAGVNLDGYIFGEPTRTAIGKPFMVLLDDSPTISQGMIDAAKGKEHRELAFTAENMNAMRQAVSAKESYLVSVRGTRHMNFCDSSLYSPLRQITHAGTIPAERGMEIINRCLLSFFDKHLKEQVKPSLGDIAARYPEVVLERLGTANADVTAGKKPW
jgi:predicted dienelactone hydrolase